MKPAEEHIPPRITILPYYVAGGFSFLLVSLMCVSSSESLLGHYFTPRLLAITHLAVLGWATMVIFGASNQLAPVIAERRLYSERIPVVVFLFKVVGIAILVFSFWVFQLGVLSYAGAGLLIAAILLHAINLYKTAARGKEDIVKDLFIVSHFWLVLTALIGLTLLLNLRFAFLSEDHLHYLRVHSLIGMGGWFLQLVIGVSSRLIPMFLLSANEERKSLQASFYLLNGAMLLFFLEGMVLGTRAGGPLCLLMVGAAIVLYARYVNRCRKTAMRKQADAGMQQSFLAIVLLMAAIVLLSFLLSIAGQEQPRLMVAFGFSFFTGFISLLILGQTFKTLPFIVWMHLVSHESLPGVMPKDLYSERWVRIQMILFLLSFLVSVSSIILGLQLLLVVGLSLLSLTAALYFGHVLYIISKLKNYEPHHI